ncbi:unnamed protein product, partial [Sphacelaria rigidula]
MAGNSTSRAVVLVGPSSAGKTTLMRELCALLPDRRKGVTEVARSLMREEGITRVQLEEWLMEEKRGGANAGFSRFQRRVLARVNQMEKLHFSSSGDRDRKNLVVFDRGGVDPIVYAKIYVSSGTGQELAVTQDAREVFERYRRQDVLVV